KMFGFGHHHKDQAPAASGPNQIFKIYCRASEDYCLAVRDGEVVLAPVNPKDETQHWLKDMRFSTTVKDEEGMPAFALVNKATGLAVKHSIGQSHPVSLPVRSLRPRHGRRPPRACRARLLQGRRGLQPHRPQRHRLPRPHQPQGRLPALDQGHEAQQQDQGRGRVPCVCAGEQGHRRMHQALHRPGPPREAGAVQPGVPGRVGAVDGEPRRGQGLPLRPHGEQHLPQLRRLPRRQGPRRRPRRHRGRALEVVRGRQPALEDPPLV
uniref:Uncharacterized protein n=1 Tax=Aegilops tauschii subsp. strangulata TaxID=200361 RepID=A0A453AN62_AEGTS